VSGQFVSGRRCEIDDRALPDIASDKITAMGSSWFSIYYIMQPKLVSNARLDAGGTHSGSVTPNEHPSCHADADHRVPCACYRRPKV